MNSLPLLLPHHTLYRLNFMHYKNYEISDSYFYKKQNDILPFEFQNKGVVIEVFQNRL